MKNIEDYTQIYYYATPDLKGVLVCTTLKDLIHDFKWAIELGLTITKIKLSEEMKKELLGK